MDDEAWREVLRAHADRLRESLVDLTRQRDDLDDVIAVFEEIVEAEQPVRLESYERINDGHYRSVWTFGSFV